MAAKSYDQWKYETFEEMGTQIESVTRIAWDAAIKSIEEKFSAYNYSSSKCPHCGKNIIITVTSSN
jgi:predicted RNA-binding Zn-ribbon protein involved in translation (DUF1610 family)